MSPRRRKRNKEAVAEDPTREEAENDVLGEAESTEPTTATGTGVSTGTAPSKKAKPNDSQAILNAVHTMQPSTATFSPPTSASFSCPNCHCQLSLTVSSASVSAAPAAYTASAAHTAPDATPAPLQASLMMPTVPFFMPSMLPPAVMQTLAQTQQRNNKASDATNANGTVILPDQVTSNDFVLFASGIRGASTSHNTLSLHAQRMDQYFASKFPSYQAVAKKDKAGFWQRLLQETQDTGGRFLLVHRRADKNLVAEELTLDKARRKILQKFDTMMREMLLDDSK